MLTCRPLPSSNHSNNDRKHKKIVEFTLQEVNGGSDKLITQDILFGRELIKSIRPSYIIQIEVAT